MTALRQRRAEVRGRRRLADAALARRHDDPARAHGRVPRERRDDDAVAFDPRLFGDRAPRAVAGRDRGRDPQLRRHQLDRGHARGAVALRAGVRGPAQRAEDDDVAGRDEFGARDSRRRRRRCCRPAGAIGRRAACRGSSGSRPRRPGPPAAARSAVDARTVRRTRRAARSARAPAKSASSERAPSSQRRRRALRAALRDRTHARRRGFGRQRRDRRARGGRDGSRRWRRRRARCTSTPLLANGVKKLGQRGVGRRAPRGRSGSQRCRDRTRAARRACRATPPRRHRTPRFRRRTRGRPPSPSASARTCGDPVACDLCCPHAIRNKPRLSTIYPHYA